MTEMQKSYKKTSHYVKLCITLNLFHIPEWENKYQFF